MLGPNEQVYFEETATGAATIATKQDWMRQAGIPESEWSYVDWLVTRESGWRPTAQGSMTSLGRACGDRKSTRLNSSH